MIVHISAVDCDNFRLLVQFVYSNGSFNFGTTKHTGIKHSAENFFLSWGVSWCYWSERGFEKVWTVAENLKTCMAG